MINTNELRIGNWVIFKGYDFDPNGNKVGDHDAQSLRPEHFNHVVAYPDLYDPVLLTPVVLVKFGFVNDEQQYDGETGVYKLGDVWVYHEENQKEAPYSVAVIDDGNHCFLDSAIRHVHQLQNLYFAVNGQELNYQP